MMRKTMMLAMMLLLAAATLHASIKGGWTAEADGDARVQINMSHGHHSNMGMTFELAELQGLTAAQLAARAVTPVAFRFANDAGVTQFEGSFKDGDGGGHFTFTATPDFLTKMKAAGVRVDEAVDEDDLFAYSMLDLTPAYVTELTGIGYRNLTLDDVFSARIHRVTAQRAREFRSMGWGNLSLDDIEALSIHGVTPQFVKQMREIGFDTSDPDDVVSMKIHGITPAFVQSMRDAGFRDLEDDDYLAMKIHGVTPQLVSELRSLGYTKLEADDVVSVRIFNITPEFIREKQKELGRLPSIEELADIKVMSSMNLGKRKHKRD